MVSTIVTLDVGSTTISSLTLGGAINGTAELTDGGTAQTLTITNALNVGATGSLQLTGGSTVTAGAASSNAGTIDVFDGSTLTITTGGFTNSGLLDAEIGSTINITGDVTNAGTMATDLNNMGGGNTLTITGNLTNSGEFGLFGAGDREASAAM